jgi:hypothetical protein
VSGVLEFANGEEEKSITIKVNDDDDVEDDETFSVVISEPSIGAIGPFGTTVVTIIDDDEPGELGIKDKDADVTVCENEGAVRCHVSRMNGSSGEISCKYASICDTSVDDVDHEPVLGELVFKNGEVSKIITIKVKDTKSIEKSAKFTVKLTDFKGPEKSKGFSSHKTECKVNIVHDAATKAMVDDVTKLMNADLEQYDVGTSSYSQQFHDAIFEIGCDEGDTPTNMDYFMHAITVRGTHI